MVRYDDDRRTDDTSWHDSTQAMVTGAIAALILVGLLIYAVVRVSGGSGDRPPLPNVVPSTSSATATSGLKTPASTSYTLPSAQTSEPVPLLPPGPPAVDAPANDPPAEETSTPTTIYNPYATTTQPNADST